MTIELVENAEEKLLEVKASGKLSAEDYEHLEPGVEKLVADAGKINILFVMSDFHGWDLGAVWEDIKFATKHCTDIEKVAMVGENTWQEWMAKCDSGGAKWRPESRFVGRPFPRNSSPFCSDIAVFNLCKCHAEDHGSARQCPAALGNQSPCSLLRIQKLQTAGH